MLEEKISKNLGVPYIYLPDKRKFLCSNGVLFTMEEYKAGIDIKEEYEKRKKDDTLFDYTYAKSTGLLRKKRKLNNDNAENKQDLKTDSTVINAEKVTVKAEKSDKSVLVICLLLFFTSLVSMYISTLHTATYLFDYTYAKSTGLLRKKRKLNNNNAEKKQDLKTDNTVIKTEKVTVKTEKNDKSVLVICLLLFFTSLVSMYISTLHTATYLFDYVDVFSAWLMSASVTAYNSTAFEVSVLFHTKKRNLIASIFMLLWILVTLFSMVTTISVFYDMFNFTESQIAEENREIDANKLSLDLLQKKEKDLRDSIDFKKKDIEYRQGKEFSTNAVRQELNKLQEELQKNLSLQQKVLEETPIIAESNVNRKESLFSFLGRNLGIEGNIIEFIMSTLSAIFVNLIAPLSLTAVTELLKQKEK